MSFSGRFNRPRLGPSAGLVSPFNPAGHVASSPCLARNRKTSPMKMTATRKLASALVAGSFTFSWSADAATMDDVQFWTGTGSKQAALVVDWNDGKSSESIAWGFRWEGTATGTDMLLAVVTADPRLYANVSAPGSFGVAVFGLGYDLNSSGNFSVTPGLTFDASGISVASYSDGRQPSDTADHWQEGWMSAGFWVYYVKDTTQASWDFSNVGASSRQLVDGAWDGWSFAPGFNDSLPSEPMVVTPVPEPSTVALAGLGAGLFLMLKRRRNRAAVIATAALACGFSAMAGPYSSAQGNTTVGAIDAGIPGYITPGGAGSGSASGNTINPIFAAWATGFSIYEPSPGVSASFMTPNNALGPVGSSIVSLGDLYSPSAPPKVGGVPVDPNVKGDAYGFVGYDAPGQITLTFSSRIGNGAGADFAVFENGFMSGAKLFAELAYVEVSSDGLNFARFASLSLTPAAVGAFGTVDTTGVYNLAGKHAAGWGTPFDLDTLSSDPLVAAGVLSLDNIGYVRLVDIPGSGDFKDSQGNSIYDAWVTTGSGGLDLDAVGVIHTGITPVPEPTTWALLATGGLALVAGVNRRKRDTTRN